MVYIPRYQLPVPKGRSITLLYHSFPIKFVEQLIHRFLMIGYYYRQTEITILVSWITGESGPEEVSEPNQTVNRQSRVGTFHS